MISMSTKGSFVLKPRLDQKIPQAKIVKLATIKYLTEDADPMNTIMESNNPVDFIISANSTDFLNVQTGENLGYKALRIVYSNSGSEFKALKNDNVNGGYKQSVVLESEKLKFLEILPKDISGLDLNYDKYCFEAWKTIYSIIKPKNDNDGIYYIPKREEGVVDWKHLKVGISVLHKGGYVKVWSKYLKELGLSVIPKNLCKKNYKGIRTRDIESWDRVDSENGLGLGVVTDTCCSIDIDNPDNLDSSLKFLLEKFPTMKVFHGEDKVLNGGKGSFIYKTTEVLKLRSSSKMVENLGFEFLNDNGKVQTVFGVHPKCELYKIEGTPIELPNEIREYLLGCETPEGKRAIGRITGRKKTIVLDNILKPDEELIFSKLKDNSITVRTTTSEADSIQIWDIEGHWFIVSRCQATGKHYVNTNHSNFLNELRCIFDGSF